MRKTSWSTGGVGEKTFYVGLDVLSLRSHSTVEKAFRLMVGLLV